MLMTTAKTDYNTLLMASEHALKDDRSQEKDGSGFQKHRWKCIRQIRGWSVNVLKSSPSLMVVPRTIGLLGCDGLGTPDVLFIQGRMCRGGDGG